jgi:hypothetical protein
LPGGPFSLSQRGRWRQILQEGCCGNAGGAQAQQYQQHRIRSPRPRTTRFWLPWSASAALWTSSVRLSWWPSGGPGGFSAPPPSRRSGLRPWRIWRLPRVRRRSTPCFRVSIGAGLSCCRGRRREAHPELHPARARRVLYGRAPGHRHAARADDRATSSASRIWQMASSWPLVLSAAAAWSGRAPRRRRDPELAFRIEGGRPGRHASISPV